MAGNETVFMSFIVLEGIDGSGKSTQINLLRQYLDKQNVNYEYLHFPRTDSPVYGELISMFLRGEFGDINTVNPYLTALLYAGDRHDASQIIRSWIKKGDLVIVDRYVYSNIAYQCAKIKSETDKKALKKWIKYLEYEYNGIPAPDTGIFLNVSHEFTKDKLTSERNGADRDYLKGKRDIHEQSLDFQKKVSDEYLSLVKEDGNFHLIDCCPDNKNMQKPEVIFDKILDLLISKEIIKI